MQEISQIVQEITQIVQEITHSNGAKPCDLLHCLKMRLVISANQNAGLLHKINSANHGIVECQNPYPDTMLNYAQ